MNNETEALPEGSNLKSFYSYKNTFDKDSVWLAVPKQGMSGEQRRMTSIVSKLPAMLRPGVLSSQQANI